MQKKSLVVYFGFFLAAALLPSTVSALSSDRETTPSQISSETANELGVADRKARRDRRQNRREARRDNRQDRREARRDNRQGRREARRNRRQARRDAR